MNLTTGELPILSLIMNRVSDYASNVADAQQHVQAEIILNSA